MISVQQFRQRLAEQKGAGWRERSGEGGIWRECEWRWEVYGQDRKLGDKQNAGQASKDLGMKVVQAAGLIMRDNTE